MCTFSISTSYWPKLTKVADHFYDWMCTGLANMHVYHYTVGTRWFVIELGAITCWIKSSLLLSPEGFVLESFLTLLTCICWSFTAYGDLWYHPLLYRNESTLFDSSALFYALLMNRSFSQKILSCFHLKNVELLRIFYLSKVSEHSE